MLLSAVDFSHKLLKETVNKGDIVIDATVGNGSDTVLLATLVGAAGKVIGFDIQKQAIENTKQKLLLAGLTDQVTLLHQGHETLADVLADHADVGGAIFNLGYLHGADKTVTTQKDTTITAVSALLPKLRIGSYILLVVYSAHPGGMEEKKALLDYVSGLNQALFKVLHYGFINQINEPPILIAIEKKKAPYMK
ncbi:class I SAM-dependent methyltransferase [Trichococcus collinsii]|uniref:rRNA methylase n=1 Tax=Trichococcus collinsii TaxID=157076 RepID=A0AB37ZXU2_9LACT|nr:class I SAM-dependent methyltransferase [Trichococcus collinsii]CZR03768.1 s-adenosyl-l-methionine-dependent methyltransferase [Trichococcus collinsii]SEA01387.1 Putative rRNA methylase [Trichococcus collinsii]